MCAARGPLVEVDGARRLRQTLKQAGDDVTQLKDVHKKVAEIALGGAKVLVPFRSGKLASTLRAAGTTSYAVLRAGYRTVPYGSPIHWGWPTRPNKEKKWRGGPIAPNEFLSLGAQNTESKWIASYEEHMKNIISKIEGA